MTATYTVTTGGSVASYQVSLAARGPAGPAGEAGASSWGQITGTLSAQTDLQNALNAKLTAASNLSDLANAGTARTNLGLGTLATLSSVSLTSNVTGTLPIANGGTGATTQSAARTNLGAGAAGDAVFTAATRTAALAALGTTYIQNTETVTATNENKALTGTSVTLADAGTYLIEWSALSQISGTVYAFFDMTASSFSKVRGTTQLHTGVSTYATIGVQTVSDAILIGLGNWLTETFWNGFVLIKANAGCVLQPRLRATSTGTATCAAGDFVMKITRLN